MTSPERDHPSLRPEPVDTSIWSPGVEMSDRHWREDNIGGWATDPRPLHIRIAEVLVANLLIFGLSVGALLLVVVIFD